MKKSKLKKKIKSLEKENIALEAEKRFVLSKYDELDAAFSVCRRALSARMIEAIESDELSHDGSEFAGIVDDMRISVPAGVDVAPAKVLEAGRLLSTFAASRRIRIESVRALDESAFDDSNLALIAMTFLSPDDFAKWATEKGLSPWDIADSEECFESADEEHACGLTQGEVMVLALHKKHPEATQEQLAGMLGMSASEVSKTIAGLGLAWKRTAPARRPKPGLEGAKDAAHVEDEKSCEGEGDAVDTTSAERSGEASEVAA